MRYGAFVGIDGYHEEPLKGCVADALSLSKILRENHDKSPNFFKSQVVVSTGGPVLKADIVRAFSTAFDLQDARTVLFFFAGHATLNRGGGFLMAQDSAEFDEGVPMAQLIDAANRSAKRFQSSERIIILDCCHAGAADELFGAGGIPLNEGVTVLAACRRDQNALEIGGRGTFSRLVGDALDGGAADVRGFVTASAVYSYIDEVMAVDEQRPLFKTNVAKFEPLRRAAPSVNDDELRRIAVYFPAPDHIYPLDPSYEPTEEPRNSENEAIFGDLQDFRSARLVVPVGEKHLYYAL